MYSSTFVFLMNGLKMPSSMYIPKLLCLFYHILLLSLLSLINLLVRIAVRKNFRCLFGWENRLCKPHSKWLSSRPFRILWTSFCSSLSGYKNWIYVLMASLMCLTEKVSFFCFKLNWIKTNKWGKKTQSKTPQPHKSIVSARLLFCYLLCLEVF